MAQYASRHCSREGSGQVTVAARSPWAKSSCLTPATIEQFLRSVQAHLHFWLFFPPKVGFSWQHLCKQQRLACSNMGTTLGTSFLHSMPRLQASSHTEAGCLGVDTFRNSEMSWPKITMRPFCFFTTGSTVNVFSSEKKLLSDSHDFSVGRLPRTRRFCFKAAVIRGFSTRFKLYTLQS